MIAKSVRAALVAFFVVAGGASAQAAEVKVFSTIGVQAALEELAPKFKEQTGHTLAVTWGTAAMLVKRVKAGESADCYVARYQPSVKNYRRDSAS